MHRRFLSAGKNRSAQGRDPTGARPSQSDAACRWHTGLLRAAIAVLVAGTPFRRILTVTEMPPAQP